MLSQEQKEKFRQEKKEKIIRIHKTLSEMSEEQRNAIAEKYGIVTVEGHLLTQHNQCFLVAQSEINFTIVAGYQQWKKSGRVVKKGEHGFLIFVPSKTKNDHEEELINDEENVHFFAATVFDISQTEVIQIKEAV